MNNSRKHNFILTAQSSFPSCREIRDNIEELTGKKYFITTDPRRITGKVIFRYGNFYEIPGEETQYNSAEFIKIAHDKAKFSEFCKENNLYSPEFKTGKPDKYPVLIRKTLTGWGGAGIVLCKSEEEFLSNNGMNYFWTPFINTQFEVRVHLFGDSVNRIYKKIPTETEEEFPIRNVHHNYHFSLVSNDNYPKIIELCKRLGNLFMEIGGNFSGVDLGYDRERKEYLIFETNSAPGLNSISAKEYAEFLVEKNNL